MEFYLTKTNFERACLKQVKNELKQNAGNKTISN